MSDDTDFLEVSILMPCLNEAETIAACIDKARGWLQRENISGEILVADNGSVDGSQELAKRAGAKVVPVEARGYGSALMGGILAARGRFIIMGDADDSYDFSSLTPFLEKLRAGYALVMGNRFSGEIRPGAMPPLHRYLGNPVLSLIGRLFFHSPCGDFHCGLRAFQREAILRLDLRTTGMEFASELVVKATLMNLPIAEVPIVLHPAGRTRPPHLRSWRDGWRHLRFLLLYCPRWLFLYPGIFLMLGGLAAGLWLLPHPRTIGRVNLDIHSLLYSALAVLLGFQAINFAVFTKVFAISEGLLPPDPAMEKLFKSVSLEMGLLLGSGLILIGAAGTARALNIWGSQSFGPLNPVEMFRLVIPAVTTLTLGVQIILSSFFLSVLSLKRR